TGGTRGIGAAISIYLKEQGYQVIANYVSQNEEAQRFSEKHHIPIVQFDVSNTEQTAEKILSIQGEFGSIDTLVHNAGITWDGFFHKATFEQWFQVINTNLISCFNVTRPLIESMRTQGFGRIVMLSSINALKGQVGQTNYCAAKAGMIGFVKSLALENANKGVTANIIAPGYIDTHMTQKIAEDIRAKIIQQIPLGRLGYDHEIARAVAFLCDEASGFMTGETLNINGGQYLS
ncbi:MAG: acetoacetyl-CoA reductase, partial [Alphaproteobacteria bacterium]|nr:acetoacetyl-CoA reductase [Alphaproteobacteria bacterium]